MAEILHCHGHILHPLWSVKSENAWKFIYNKFEAGNWYVFVQYYFFVGIENIKNLLLKFQF